MKLKQTVLSLLRHLLTLAGGSLVAKGVIDDAGLMQLVGLVVAVIGAAWGAVDEYLAERKEHDRVGLAALMEGAARTHAARENENE